MKLYSWIICHGSQPLSFCSVSVLHTPDSCYDSTLLVPSCVPQCHPQLFDHCPHVGCLLRIAISVFNSISMSLLLAVISLVWTLPLLFACVSLSWTWLAIGYIAPKHCFLWDQLPREYTCHLLSSSLFFSGVRPKLDKGSFLE